MQKKKKKPLWVLQHHGLSQITVTTITTRFSHKSHYE